MQNYKKIIKFDLKAVVKDQIIKTIETDGAVNFVNVDISTLPTGKTYTGDSPINVNNTAISFIPTATVDFKSFGLSNTKKIDLIGTPTPSAADYDIGSPNDLVIGNAGVSKTLEGWVKQYAPGATPYTGTDPIVVSNDDISFLPTKDVNFNGHAIKDVSGIFGQDSKQFGIFGTRGDLFSGLLIDANADPLAINILDSVVEGNQGIEIKQFIVNVLTAFLGSDAGKKIILDISNTQLGGIDIKFS